MDSVNKEVKLMLDPNADNFPQSNEQIEILVLRM